MRTETYDHKSWLFELKQGRLKSYHFNHIMAREDVIDALREVHELQEKSYRLQIKFGVVFMKTTYDEEKKETIKETVLFAPSTYTITDYWQKSKMIDTETSLDLAIMTVTENDEMMEAYFSYITKNYHASMLGIWGMKVMVTPLDFNFGGCANINIIGWKLKSPYIYTFLDPTQLDFRCFWRCLVCFLNPTLNERRCNTPANKLFEQFYKKKYNKKVYKGVDLIELDAIEDEFNIAIIVLQITGDVKNHTASFIRKSGKMELVPKEKHMYLDLEQNHFMLIKLDHWCKDKTKEQPLKCLVQSYKCSECELLCPSLSLLKQHQTGHCHKIAVDKFIDKSTVNPLYAKREPPQVTPKRS